MCVLQRPMEKMRQVSPHSLEGDSGWQMRDTYSDCMKDLDKSVLFLFMVLVLQVLSLLLMLFLLWL